mmetsp:Transcript_26397/g.42428  ORF Transcript_26397/g.42428 Transcript_26397/m.42428 type:complete len:81 (+) Transcript_26397:21-263(+)
MGVSAFVKANVMKKLLLCANNLIYSGADCHTSPAREHAGLYFSPDKDHSFASHDVHRKSVQTPQQHAGCTYLTASKPDFL